MVYTNLNRGVAMTSQTMEVVTKELNAVYGMYTDGNIVLDEPTPKNSDSRVVVVFLGGQNPQKPKLADFFDLYGAWEDDRDADAIIADIYTSRHSKQDIQL
jgi:hypothetical protein